MNISEFSIRNPVFAWMLMFGLILFGSLSFMGMGVSQNPDVDFPYVSVRLTYTGAAPEVMEKDVVDPIEGAVVSIEGIRSITSSARNGSADVSIEFELDKNIDVAVQEVQTQISRAQRNLPTDMEPPIVTKSNPEDRPIMWISVSSGKLSTAALMDLVKNRVQDQFSTVSGVSEIILGGYVEPALNVFVNSKKLSQYQLGVDDVISTIQSEHLELPAGRIENDEREKNLRVMGEVLNVEDFQKLNIKRRGGVPNYRPIALEDLAVVEEGLSEVRRISRVNGESAVGIGIRKQRGSNTVAVADAVKERMERVRATLPEGVDIGVNYDSTPYIEDSVDELVFTLILSALLTALVCWVFLGSFSSVLNILLAIPTSIIGTFIVINFMGFTLNTFTLLALSLAVGIVVDDAIIVLENIMRYRETGRSRIESAIVGSRQIMFAVIATTAALIAIFLPVAYMDGIIGRFFFEFAVTISVAVAFSSLEALTLAPMRCSQFLSAHKRSTRIGQMFEAGMEVLNKLYAGLLSWVLRYRVSVVLVAFAMFAISLLLFKHIEREFAPDQDESRLFMTLETPLGSSLSFTDTKVREVEEILKEFPEVDRYFLAIGGFAGDQSNSAISFVTLKSPEERPVWQELGRRPSQKDLAFKVRERLKQVKDVKVFVRPSSGSVIGGGRGFPIDFTVRGPDWKRLVESSTEIEKRMTESGYFSDIKRADVEGGPELRIYPDRKMATKLGVEVGNVSRTIQALFGGVPVALYSKGGQRYDVRVQLRKSERETTEALDRIQVRNNRGELIPIRQLVKIEEALTPPTITREERARAISITANPGAGYTQAQAMDKVDEIAAGVLSGNHYIAFSGASKTYTESFRNLLIVLGLGIIVSYMVLASQFNSFIDPLLVLVALPFAATGALIALYLGGQTLNIYSMIGMILLMGIAVKNSIILIEFTNQLRDEGKGVKEAILEACPLRLRPILMTSFATIAAAVPAAVNFGPGAETRIPMAVVVIGGMLVSTVFTLVVVPSLYSLTARRRVHIAEQVEEIKNKRSVERPLIDQTL